MLRTAAICGRIDLCEGPHRRLPVNVPDTVNLVAHSLSVLTSLKVAIRS